MPKKTQAFSAHQSHYLFAEMFGRPANGNDKGRVEGLVGYTRRNFIVPIPRFVSWEEFNTELEYESRKRRQRRLRGHASIWSTCRICPQPTYRRHKPRRIS